VLIREITEKNEHLMFSRFAAFSDESLGRDREEPQCDIRTVYQRDRDRVIHCKSFRRLKHKTQVFLSPGGDHYRTRLTHTLEVSQIARTIAMALRVNEDLTEAIALGHDLGHTPFGHAGERALSAVSGKPFRHNEQSVRVVEKLENDGRGLNLTKEVRSGILNHKTNAKNITMEGSIVQLSDKIAYINHDIDDGIRAGILTPEDLPEMCTMVLGYSARERIDRLIHDVINSSMDNEYASMSSACSEALFNLRRFMFDFLYTNPAAKSEEQKAIELIGFLFDYYKKHENEMSDEYIKMLESGEDLNTIVCDYIAGMTDNYAAKKFRDIYIPKCWSVM